MQPSRSPFFSPNDWRVRSWRRSSHYECHAPPASAPAPPRSSAELAWGGGGRPWAMGPPTTYPQPGGVRFAVTSLGDTHGPQVRSAAAADKPRAKSVGGMAETRGQQWILPSSVARTPQLRVRMSWLKPPATALAPPQQPTLSGAYACSRVLNDAYEMPRMRDPHFFRSRLNTNGLPDQGFNGARRDATFLTCPGGDAGWGGLRSTF